MLLFSTEHSLNSMNTLLALNWWLPYYPIRLNQSDNHAMIENEMNRLIVLFPSQWSIFPISLFIFSWWLYMNSTMHFLLFPYKFSHTFRKNICETNQIIVVNKYSMLQFYVAIGKIMESSLTFDLAHIEYITVMSHCLWVCFPLWNTQLYVLLVEAKHENA